MRPILSSVLPHSCLAPPRAPSCRIVQIRLFHKVCLSIQHYLIRNINFVGLGFQP